MGTVVRTCVDIGHVEGTGIIVKDKGKLGIVVGSIEHVGHLTGIQLFPDLIDGLTGHGIQQCIFRQSTEAGMVHLDTGIQDGHTHALTGVAGLVGSVCTDHGGGIVGVLLKVLILRNVEGRSHIHLRNIFHGFQLCLVAVGSGHGETGGCNGIGETELEALFIAEGVLHAVLNGGQNILLLLCMGLHRSGVVGNFIDGEQLQLGLLVNDDDKGNHIVCLGAGQSYILGEALPAAALILGQSRNLGVLFPGVFGNFGGSLSDTDGGFEFSLFGGSAVGQIHNGKCVGNTAKHHGQNQNQG